MDIIKVISLLSAVRTGREALLPEKGKDPEIQSNNVHFVGTSSVSSFAYFLLLIALHTQKGKKKQNHYRLLLPGSNDKQPLSGETLMTGQAAHKAGSPWF